MLPSLATLLTGGGGGGSGSGGGRQPVDLLLVDFSANDEFERQDWLEGRSSFGQASERDKSRAVAAATEALLRYVATALPTTAVVPSANAAHPHVYVDPARPKNLLYHPTYYRFLNKPTAQPYIPNLAGACRLVLFERHRSCSRGGDPSC